MDLLVVVLTLARTVRSTVMYVWPFWEFLAYQQFLFSLLMHCAVIIMLREGVGCGQSSLGYSLHRTVRSFQISVLK